MFGRLMILIALLTVAVAYGARHSDGAAASQVYVVRAGDTLWSIGAAHYAGDPRRAVWRLEDRNHLAGAILQPGQRLTLP